MTEELTSEEREALDEMSALYGGIGAKLLRLYDAALARILELESYSWRAPDAAYLSALRNEIDGQFKRAESLSRSPASAATADASGDALRARVAQARAALEQSGYAADPDIERALRLLE